MSEIIAYKNKLWKVMNDYRYTGESETLSIDPGEYLLICNGASGGIGSYAPLIPRNYGGVSMGVITLTSQTNMFIYVGGDGGDGLIQNVVGLGGFNGGANGGQAYSTSYNGGAGGGGASDIRINTDSLYSRVIVAGGAGGGTNLPSQDTTSYNGFGGGAYGGLIISATDDPNLYKYASQNNGYSFGGTGQVPITKTTNCRYGAGGGGGGWYTGYAIQSTSTNSHRCGGGGSGYVLTESSYKPEGYLLGEEYYLKDIYMACGIAEYSCVKICSEIQPRELSVGDKITYPFVGDVEHTILPTGKYTMKCYGGFGGYRTSKVSIPLGGFAQGTIEFNNFKDVYVRVGGSGFTTITTGVIDDSAYNNVICPNKGFNGGGEPCAFGDYRSSYAGGASDIRINTDSLYSRVIVAGGAGGNGSESSGSRYGGVGGGSTGGIPTQTSRGTILGPGTEYDTPQEQIKPTIQGSFGIGGNAVATSSGQFPGPGGGGWFGGSGCRSDSSGDDERGGCGGSGYVLTESTYKPEGYLLGEEYYMTNVVLTAGGNNLNNDVTKITIDVEDIQLLQIICKDSEGYKTFDNAQNKWVYFAKHSVPITESMFSEYGVYNFKNDNGLLNEYEIIINDINDDYTSCNLNVVPNKQIVSKTINSQMYIKRTTFDADYFDNNEYDLSINSTRSGSGNDSQLTVNIEIDKHVDDVSKTTDLSLYCVSIFSQ